MGGTDKGGTDKGGVFSLFSRPQANRGSRGKGRASLARSFGLEFESPDRARGAEIVASSVRIAHRLQRR